MPIDTKAAAQAAQILDSLSTLVLVAPGPVGTIASIGVRAGSIIAGAFASSGMSAEEAKRQALASVAALIDEIAALPEDIAAQHEQAIEEAIK